MSAKFKVGDYVRFTDRDVWPIKYYLDQFEGDIIGRVFHHWCVYPSFPARKNVDYYDIVAKSKTGSLLSFSNVEDQYVERFHPPYIIEIPKEFQNVEEAIALAENAAIHTKDIFSVEVQVPDRYARQVQD